MDVSNFEREIHRHTHTLSHTYIRGNERQCAVSAQCFRCIAICGTSPFSGADFRAHGTLFPVRFVVTDRRGDIGGLCVDLGNNEGSSLPSDNVDIYSDISYVAQ